MRIENIDEQQGLRKRYLHVLAVTIVVFIINIATLALVVYIKDIVFVAIEATALAGLILSFVITTKNYKRKVHKLRG